MSDDVSTSDPLFLAGRIALLSSLCAMLMHKSYGKDSFDKVIEEAITMIEGTSRNSSFSGVVDLESG